MRSDLVYVTDEESYLATSYIPEQPDTNPSGQSNIEKYGISYHLPDFE